MRQNTDRREYNVCVGSQKTVQGGNILCYVGGLAARGRSIGGSKNGAGWQGGLAAAAAVARRHLDVGKGRCRLYASQGHFHSQGGDQFGTK